MSHVHHHDRFLAVPSDDGGRPVNKFSMNNNHRLLILIALIVAEPLCAQSVSTDGGPGPRRGGPGGPGGPGRLPPIIRVLDADKNAEISAAEIANASAALLTLDANGDGTLSASELRPAHPAMGRTPPADAPQPPADAPRGPGRGRGRGPGAGDHPRPVMPLMLALDANSDGDLSAAEISNAPASLLALDANKDGKLTRDELRPLPPTE